MEVELLHIHHGDKRKKIDTQTPEGKNEVERLLKNLCEQKCAIFLERGTKTYRVTGYDKETDQLIVQRPYKGRGKIPKAENMTVQEAKRAYCRVEAAPAKVAAVAPVAGGAELMANDEGILHLFAGGIKNTLVLVYDNGRKMNGADFRSGVALAVEEISLRLLGEDFDSYADECRSKMRAIGEPQ